MLDADGSTRVQPAGEGEEAGVDISPVRLFCCSTDATQYFNDLGRFTDEQLVTN